MCCDKNENGLTMMDEDSGGGGSTTVINGTWTPYFANDEVGTVYSTQNGVYTTIGNFCSCNCRLVVTSYDMTGENTVSLVLPKTSASVTQYAPITVEQGGNSFAYTATTMGGIITAGSSVLTVYLDVALEAGDVWTANFSYTTA